MIEYVFPNNIDDRIIKKACEILQDGGLVAFPGDSSWLIGCSSQSKPGIEKLKKIKGDFSNYTLTLTCSSISQIQEVADLNNSNFKYIKQYIPGPYVFILSANDSIEKKVNMKRIEIGVRIPQNPIPISIINFIKSPVFTMTASKKLSDKTLWDDAFAEENLYEYGCELDDINQLDMIIDSGNPLEKNLSTVINLTGEIPEIIRYGSGII